MKITYLVPYLLNVTLRAVSRGTCSGIDCVLHFVKAASENVGADLVELGVYSLAS